MGRVQTGTHRNILGYILQIVKGCLRKFAKLFAARVLVEFADNLRSETLGGLLVAGHHGYPQFDPDVADSLRYARCRGVPCWR